MKKRRREAIESLKKALEIYERLLAEGAAISKGGMKQLEYAQGMLYACCGILNRASELMNAMRDYPLVMDKWAGTYSEDSKVSKLYEQMKLVIST